MKIGPLGWNLFGATLGASLPFAGNAPPRAPQAQLVRVAPADPAQLADWRKRLESTDLDLREQSFGALIDAARRDPRLERALEDWARDENARELAWTARLALRELRESAPPIGLMFDPFARGLDIDALRRQMLEGLDFRPFDTAPPAGGGLQVQSESLSLETGPDGVKCRLTRKQNGQDVTEEYQAESIEKLLEAHPELRSKLGGGSASPFGAGPRWRGFELQPQWLQPPLDASPSSSVRTDILGVAVLPLSTEEASALALEPGNGLRIERVEPGTIAQQLGLQRGHVLVEINGLRLRSRDDISAQLKARGASGALEVVVIDRWGQRRTRTWNPGTGKQV